jgi:hypothetical protein
MKAENNNILLLATVLAVILCIFFKLRLNRTEDGHSGHLVMFNLIRALLVIDSKALPYVFSIRLLTYMSHYFGFTFPSDLPCRIKAMTIQVL